MSFYSKKLLTRTDPGFNPEPENLPPYGLGQGKTEERRHSSLATNRLLRKRRLEARPGIGGGGRCKTKSIFSALLDRGQRTIRGEGRDGVGE